MSPLATRATLLLRIRDPKDRDAWAEFVDLYMPLLYSYAVKHGLQEADAADVAQESLFLVVRVIPTFQYKPAKGSFRGWLLTILRNQIRRRANKLKLQYPGTGDTAIMELLHEQPARSEIDAWEHEYQLHLFHWAANRVKNTFRESTWNAFWLTTVDGCSITETSERLQMSEGAIYVARSRALARIRKEIQDAEEEGPSNE